MENKKDDLALSVFLAVSLVIHLLFLLIIPFSKLESLMAGYGNDPNQTTIINIRLTGSGTPQSKSAVTKKPEEPSQAEEKPKGNTEEKPKPDPKPQPEVKKVQETVVAPKKTGEPVKNVAPQPKAIKTETPAPKAEPSVEKQPEVKIITSEASNLAVDLDAPAKDGAGKTTSDEGKGGSTATQSGSPDGNSDQIIIAKGEDYITNRGGSGGFTTKNIQSLEYTGVLELVFEVDSEGKMTVLLVKGLGDDRFNKELVSFAQKSWVGRFDTEAKAKFPNGYKVPVTVVFEKGNGTHKFGNVAPLE
jgi:outer membrane biosynthesis protein TonB